MYIRKSEATGNGWTFPQCVHRAKVTLKRFWMKFNLRKRKENRLLFYALGLNMLNFFYFSSYDGGPHHPGGAAAAAANLRRSRSIHTKFPPSGVGATRRNPYDYLPDEPPGIGPKPDIMQSTIVTENGTSRLVAKSASPR